MVSGVSTSRDFHTPPGLAGYPPDLALRRPRAASERVLASLQVLQIGWILSSASVPPSASGMMWSRMLAATKRPAFAHGRHFGSRSNSSRRRRCSFRPRTRLVSAAHPCDVSASVGWCCGHRPDATRFGQRGTGHGRSGAIGLIVAPRGSRCRGRPASASCAAGSHGLCVWPRTSRLPLSGLQWLGCT